MKPQSANFEISRLAPMATACMLLGACSTPFGPAKVDASSPVAAEVAKLAESRKAYPRFSDIPKVPTDMRPVRQFGQAADQLELAKADLVARTGPETWTLTGGEDFAEKARAAVPAAGPVTSPDSEAYARELRERATPPPPR